MFCDLKASTVSASGRTLVLGAESAEDQSAATQSGHVRQGLKQNEPCQVLRNPCAKRRQMDLSDTEQWRGERKAFETKNNKLRMIRKELDVRDRYLGLKKLKTDYKPLPYNKR